MKFCTACGGGLSHRIPDGDTRLRHVCDHCGEIHYVNPKLVVGTLPVWQDQVLLCRRAIEPRLGLWTLPAGFMELGETAAAAASRETEEEACARVQLEGLFSLVSIPHIGQVHLFYRARLLDTAFAPGEETLETRLFAQHEIPWEELAFRSVSQTLERFFADRSRGEGFRFHEFELGPPSGASM